MRRAVLLALLVLTAGTAFAVSTPSADACPQNPDGYPHCPGGSTCVDGVCVPTCIRFCPE